MSLDTFRRTVLWATLLLILLAAVHLMVGGSVPISPDQVLREFIAGDQGEGGTNAIIWKLRLPRLAAAVIAGAWLASVGGVFQAYFRNPLAEPYVVGVSSGSAVAGICVVLAGMSALAGGLLMSVAGFFGGLAAVGLVVALSGGQRKSSSARFILSGVVVGSFLAALTSVLILASGGDTNQVLRWLMGSLTPMDWPRIATMALIGGAGFVWLYKLSPRLNAYWVGADMPRAFGIETQAMDRSVMLAATAMVGTVVGSVGVIGFVGLVAPHIARLCTGADLRKSLPVSALVGSGLLVASDFLAQKVAAGMELPVGAVTAIIGAPVLLWLMRRV